MAEKTFQLFTACLAAMTPVSDGGNVGSKSVTDTQVRSRCGWYAARSLEGVGPAVCLFLYRPQPNFLQKLVAVLIARLTALQPNQHTCAHCNLVTLVDNNSVKAPRWIYCFQA